MALQNLIKLMSKNLPASFVMISQFLKPVMKEQSLEIENRKKPREHCFVALCLTFFLWNAGIA